MALVLNQASVDDSWKPPEGTKLRTVFLSEVMIGEILYDSRGRQQSFVVVSKTARGIRVRALGSYGGQGSASVMKNGEVRDIDNGHQFCKRIRRAVPDTRAVLT